MKKFLPIAVLFLTALSFAQAPGTSSTGGLTINGGATFGKAPVSGPPGPMTIYVAPFNCSDANAGDINNPLCTLDAARLKIRGTPGSSVFLRGCPTYSPCEYFFPSPSGCAGVICFDSGDSGTALLPMVYATFPGETAVVSGGLKLSNVGWTKGAQVDNYIPYTSPTLTGLVNSEALYYNGERRFRPRTTPTSYLYEAGSCFATDVSGVGNCKKVAAGTTGCATNSFLCFDRFKYNGIDVSGGYHGIGLGDIEIDDFEKWTMSRMRLKSAGGGVALTTGNTQFDVNSFNFGWLCSVSGGTNSCALGHRFIVENVREALTQPKQYYLDRCPGCAPSTTTPASGWKITYNASVPFTPFANLTGNTTSACGVPEPSGGCNNPFLGLLTAASDVDAQTQVVDAVPGAMSPLPFSMYMYSKWNGQFLPQLQPWFCNTSTPCNTHINIGMQMSNTAQIHAQVTKMIKRYTNGATGPGILMDDYGDSASQAYNRSVVTGFFNDALGRCTSAFCPAQFAVELDKGAIQADSYVIGGVTTTCPHDGGGISQAARDAACTAVIEAQYDTYESLYCAASTLPVYVMHNGACLSTLFISKSSDFINPVPTWATILPAVLAHVQAYTVPFEIYDRFGAFNEAGTTGQYAWIQPVLIGAGTVNTSGTTVTWVSGTKFDSTWTGSIKVNGSLFAISSVGSCGTGSNNCTSITLTATAGTNTGVNYGFRTDGDLCYDDIVGDNGTPCNPVTGVGGGTSYLNSFYAGAVSSGQPAIGAIWGKFNWTWANWNNGQHKLTGAQCGMVLQYTAAKAAAGGFSVSRQLPFVQIVTENDYEEGTELETGIDNCYTLSASITGDTISWTRTATDATYANPATIHHYTVIFKDATGQTYPGIDNIPVSATSQSLLGALPFGSWTVCVTMVPMPGLLEKTSNCLPYTSVSGPPLPQTEDPTNVANELIIPQKTQIVLATGTQFVNFSGITFAHDNWFPSAAGQQEGTQGGLGVTAAIALLNTNHIHFDSVTVRNIMGWAFDVQTDGAHPAADNQVTNSLMYDLGYGGIRQGKIVNHAADTDSNVPSFSIFSGNIIKAGGRVMASGIGTGIWIGNSPHNTVSHNDISDFYNGAIRIGYSLNITPGCGNAHDNIVSFNRLTHLGQGVTSDMAGIYMASSCTTGNQLLSNYVADVTHNFKDNDGYGGNGLYVDQGTSNVLLKNNFVLRTSNVSLFTNISDVTTDNFALNNTLTNNLLMYPYLAFYARNTQGPSTFISTKNIMLWGHGRIQNCPGQWGPFDYQGNSVALNTRFTMDQNDYFAPNGAALGFLEGTVWPRASGCTTGYTTFSTLAAWRTASALDANSTTINPQMVDFTYPNQNFHLKPGSPIPGLTGYVDIPYEQAGTTTSLSAPSVPAAFPTYEYDPVADYGMTTSGGAPLLSFTSGAPPNGTVGVPYSHTLTATGGTLPYTFSVQSGTLPTNLNLNGATGKISGTPNTIQTQTLTFLVTDSTLPTHQTAPQGPENIQIVAGIPPLSINSPNCGPGQVGVAYTCSATATGGTLPYTWIISAGSVPPGTTFTTGSNTAQVAGNPSTPGSYSFTFQVTDSTPGTPQVQTQVNPVTISPGSSVTGENFYCGLGDICNFGGADGPAQLPAAGTYTGMDGTPSPGSTVTVASDCSDLASKLSAATAGQTIVIPAVATCNGSFTIPKVTGSDINHWLTIRTDQTSNPAFPAEHSRITPCAINMSSVSGYPAYPCAAPAQLVPKFTCTTTNCIIFQPTAGANFVRFIGLEFTNVAGTGEINNYLINLSAGADHIIFDRIICHAQPNLTWDRNSVIKGCMTWNNSTHIAAINSYMYDTFCTNPGACTDSQAIAGGNDSVQAGPFKIYNNFLASGGEAWIFGGGIATLTPNDIEIRSNHAFHPLNWFLTPPVTNPWPIVKNNGEMKNGNRFLYEGNIAENDWSGLQSDQLGTLWILTPKNGHGNQCPICVVTNGTVRYNLLRHGVDGLGISTAKADDGGQALGIHFVSAHDNQMDDLNAPFYNNAPSGCCGNGFAFKVSNDHTNTAAWPNDIKMDHNTAFTIGWNGGKGQGLFYSCDGIVGATGTLPVTYFKNIQITNNISSDPMEGFLRSGCGQNPPQIPPGAGLGVSLFNGNMCSDNNGGLSGGSCTYNVQKNLIGKGVFSGQGSFAPYPSTNTFCDAAGTLTCNPTVGAAWTGFFVNFNGGNGGDYHLVPGSPYHNAGTDGKDLGADIDKVLQYTLIAN